MNLVIIAALIQALTQEVNLLEQQLAQLQASSTVATSTYVAPTVSSDTTPVVEPVTQTIISNSMDNVGTASTAGTPGTGTAPAPETISVSFATSSESEGLVTVKNTLGVPVRIVNLDVDGTLAGFSIGETYGKGFVYPPSFTDTQGDTFNVFTCTGLGSLGMANMGSSGKIDPCVRRDARVAKNELQPDETMILRYAGNPTKVTYQAGSIVEVATGNDVQF